MARAFEIKNQTFEKSIYFEKNTYEKEQKPRNKKSNLRIFFLISPKKIKPPKKR